MPEATEDFRIRANPTGQGLFLIALSLLALGVVVVHSAVVSVSDPGPWYARREVRHTVFAVIALGMLLTAWRVNYRWWAKGEKIPIVAAVTLGVALLCGALVFVPGVGREVGGFHRWIRVGPEEYGIGFQPSEIIKLALVVFLAAWLTRAGAEPRSWRVFVPAVLAAGLCAGVVVTQDFGTAALICVSAGATMLFAGVPILYLLLLVAPMVGGFYVFVVRVPHRWDRIIAMNDVWSQGNPTTYQPRQSLIGILTGGWTGRGLGAGMQKMFLPENSTDFIFSVYCEEAGFVGAMLLFALILVWLWQVRRTAVRANDSFGQVLVASLGFLIGFQAILHIAVDMVAAPPTGMSFPFVSAGGTGLVMMAGATALMMSVGSRSGPVEA